MMRLLLVSLLLSQLLICLAFPLSTRPIGRVLDCDDPETHEAAAVALHHINAGHHHGYKYVVNRVENVKVLSGTPSGEIFLLELDLLETKCPAVSPTPVQNCTVRTIIEQAVEGDCDVRLQKLGGNFTVRGVNCKSELDSAETILRMCPNCSLLAPLSDTKVVHAVDLFLLKFNKENNTVFYKLHEIGRAQIQSVPSNKVNVEFVVAATNCSLADAHLGLRACDTLSGDNAHYGACAGTLFKHQDERDEITVQCTVYEPQPGQDYHPVTHNDSLGFIVPHAHFHHNLHHSSLGHHSSESSSAEEHLSATHVNHAVKRSITGEPVAPSVTKRQSCPGKKIFF